MNKLDFKMKSLFPAKDPVKWMKRQATDRQKRLGNYIPNK